MKMRFIGKISLSIFFSVILIYSMIGRVNANNIFLGALPLTNNPQIEVVNPYYTIKYITTSDGSQIEKVNIHGPSEPIPEYQAEREASMTSIEPEGIIPNFPSYSWVFGCSAVSGAMIAAYYDRGSFPNLYTGPTDGGIMPLTDISWPTWSDGFKTYPNNPLVASHNGVDGRSSKGSIDDYWIKYDSTDQNPYITGEWPQHTWETAIGDYMKTSQSDYYNTDGSTSFYNWKDLPDKLTCEQMVKNNISQYDGTYGRKLFYEARGYTVTDCYNQKTNNNGGNFTLDNFKAEIDAGNPVLLNLQGHSIVGYGYNGSTIYIRDTWDNDPSHSYTMPWGGSYLGMSLMSVSIVHPVAHTSSYRSYLPLAWKEQQPIINPFLNPGFEQGHVSWTEYSAGGWPIIYEAADVPSDPFIPAHSGSWFAWLGGGNNETSRLSQSITISASAPYLHYWYYSVSNNDCGHDYFKIKVNDATVFTRDHCNLTHNAWVSDIFVNLSGYLGSYKTITFELTTDGSNFGSVFLDDVSMSNSASAMAEEPEAIIEDNSVTFPKK